MKIDELNKEIEKELINLIKDPQKRTLISLRLSGLVIEKFRLVHSKALAAHCECLGMNAENMWAALTNSGPLYRSEHYCQILQKWGLADEKGEPLI